MKLDLFIASVIIRQSLSELHSFRVGKTVHGDPRKIRPRQPFVSQTSRQPRLSVCTRNVFCLVKCSYRTATVAGWFAIDVTADIAQTYRGMDRLSWLV